MRAIGPLALEEVRLRLRDIVSKGENDEYFLQVTPYYLIKPGVLWALGMTARSSPTHVTLEDDGGVLHEVALPDVEADPDRWVDPYETAPLGARHAADAFWFSTLPGTRAAYVVFNAYDDLRKHSRRMFEYIDDH